MISGAARGGRVKELRTAGLRCMPVRPGLTMIADRWHPGASSAAPLLSNLSRMQALVSVVIPVYNGERFVAEAVDSALAQDHLNKEILVIDDGSSDRSLDILARYGNAIRVISVRNGGPARARNLGMSEARGEYIALLDADDVWARSKLAAQVAHMQAHPATGACYTAWHVWPADAAGKWHRPAGWLDDLGAVQAVPGRSGWIYSELLLECQLLTTTVMLRTAVARA